MSETVYPWIKRAQQRYQPLLRNRPTAILLCHRPGDAMQQWLTLIVQQIRCLDQDNAPCGVCQPCRNDQWQCPQVHMLGSDDETRVSVDAVRQVIDRLSRSAAYHQVVIIRRAEMMTVQAANAVLKTLEEPQPRRHFILVTERPKRILATVRSRCIALSMPLIQQNELSQYQYSSESLVAQMLVDFYQQSPLILHQALQESKEKEPGMQTIVDYCSGKAGVMSCCHLPGWTASEVVWAIYWLLRQQLRRTDCIQRTKLLEAVSEANRYLAIANSTMAMTATYQLERCLIRIQRILIGTAR